MDLFKQFLKQLGILIVIANFIIVPAVFYFSFKNQCVKVGIPGSEALEGSCGYLSNPIINILFLNVLLIVVCFVKFAFYKPPEQDN